MGLLQRAIETYDANTALIGVYRDGHEPLAPIGHILTSANIEITLNAQGKFLAARKVDKKEPKIPDPGDGGIQRPHQWTCGASSL